MKKRMELSGMWEGQALDLGTFQVYLPGTLDTNGIGNTDIPDLSTRLTRIHTYEGKVRYSRKIIIPKIKEGHLFLKIERTKELSVKVNGKECKAYEEGTMSTPWWYEISEYAGQEVKLTLTVDNYYICWPRSSIIGSSAATDETQTNWNGVLGDMAIYETENVFFEDLRIYPLHEKLEIQGKINGISYYEAKKRNLTIILKSDSLEEKSVKLSCDQWLEIKGERSDEKWVNIKIKNLHVDKDCQKWDENEGNLYSINVSVVEPKETETQIIAAVDRMFGIREFAVDNELRLTMNRRHFFLRGEANCCVFPETGHPPMTKAAWKKVLRSYAEYGVNCMRFHSWCPPEAAFIAADEMGMLMQPELSQWNFKDAFADEKSRDYYTKELFAILKVLANHPSFVMLTFGNELQYTEEGSVYAGKLLDKARDYDSTRLYANSSNYHYGEVGIDSKSDFYTAMAYGKEMLRATSSPMIGHLNHEYPSSKHTYEKTVKEIQKDGKTVFGFEVGQYEVLPDFSEIEKFMGITRAVNLEIVKEKVLKQGILSEWEKYVQATGELALICYREEVEAVLRTEGMSGLSLLGLQDFPGQGTALVGMMNSHLEAKPYEFSRPERFRKFFTSQLPLVYLEKYTYEGGEHLQAELRFANYGKKQEICESGWKLVNDKKVVKSGTFEKKLYPNGEVRTAGTIELSLPEEENAIKYELRVFAGDIVNQYSIWVYPKKKAQYPENVIVVRELTESVLKQIEAGQTVLLDADISKENFKTSVNVQFTTDFWSVGTFPEQEGTMGLLIEKEHPALKKFPTEMHSDYQWWPMSKGKAMILPKQIHPIITVMDSCSKLRHMGLLFEAVCGKGKIMISSMNLSGNQQYPECGYLLQCLVEYLSENQKSSMQTVTEEELRQIIKVYK